MASNSEPPADFEPGALYIAAFAQASSPHAGLLIPQSSSSGLLVHIRVDRAVSPFWMYQARQQKIQGDMFLTTLLRMTLSTTITEDRLKEAAMAVAPPRNDEFGECVAWVLEVLRELGVLQVADTEALRKEVDEFAGGNKAFARRDRVSNVAVSRYCHRGG